MPSIVDCSVRDTNNLNQVPVEGLAITATAGTLSAGQLIRPVAAIGDGNGSTTYAAVETTQPGASDPALITRGFVSIEDLGAWIRSVFDRIETPVYIEGSTGRTRVTLDAIGAVTLPTVTTVTTVTTCATLTNQSTKAGFDMKQTELFAYDDFVFSQLIRSRVT